MEDQEAILENLDFVDYVLDRWHILVYYQVCRKRVGKTMDVIADALIRIKNGYRVGKESVELRNSKLILLLVKLLEKEGFVGKVESKDRIITVELKYTGRVPALTDVKRVSRPSLRVYKGVKDIPYVLNGLGIAVVSTPKGLLTDKQARKEKVGGEIMALVW